MALSELNAAGGEERRRQRTRAAARRAHGDPLAGERRQCVDPLAAPHEDPQRLVVEARQHDHRVGLGKPGHAPLHEGDVHSRLRIEQQAQILGAALGDPHFERHAFAGERLFVALCLPVIQTRFGTGRENDPAWRNRLQELERHPQAGRERQHGQQNGTQ